MREWVCRLSAFAVVLAGAGQGRAGFTVYTSQAAFEAAAAGLNHQNFLSANVAPGSQAFVNGPLTSTTNNGVFSPGDILPGLTISSAGSTSLGNMIYVPGVGTVGNNVPGVYTNGSNATLSLGFSPQVTAVGMTLISFTNNTGPRTYNVDVLGSFSSSPVTYLSGVLPDSGSGVFLGFIGTLGEQIQRISFQPIVSTNVGVLGVEFGNPGAGPVSATPAPPTVIAALLALGVLVPFGRSRLKAPAV